MRDDHPVFFDSATNAYVLSRYADVAAVLNDFETYSAATYEGSTGAVLGPTMISMDHGGHVWRRSIVAPELVGSRLANSQAVLDRAIDELLTDCLGPTRRFDLVRQLTTKLPVHVIADLFANPSVLDSVRDDPALLDACFSETMRRDPPVIYEDRFARRDVEWHGVSIRAGSRVRVCIGAAHHDESVFADPDRFDPFRSDLHLGLEHRTGRYVDGVSGHLGFGVGKHFCVGYELARLEALSASRALLQRAPDLRPDGPVPPLVLTRGMRSTPTLAVLY